MTGIEGNDETSTTITLTCLSATLNLTPKALASMLLDYTAKAEEGLGIDARMTGDEQKKRRIGEHVEKDELFQGLLPLSQALMILTLYEAKHLHLRACDYLQTLSLPRPLRPKQDLKSSAVTLPRGGADSSLVAFQALEGIRREEETQTRNSNSLSSQRNSLTKDGGSNKQLLPKSWKVLMRERIKASIGLDTVPPHLKRMISAGKNSDVQVSSLRHDRLGDVTYGLLLRGCDLLSLFGGPESGRDLSLSSLSSLMERIRLLSEPEKDEDKSRDTALLRPEEGRETLHARKSGQEGSGLSLSLNILTTHRKLSGVYYWVTVRMTFSLHRLEDMEDVLYRGYRLKRRKAAPPLTDNIETNKSSLLFFEAHSSMIGFPLRYYLSMETARTTLGLQRLPSNGAEWRSLAQRAVDRLVSVS